MMPPPGRPVLVLRTTRRGRRWTRQDSKSYGKRIRASINGARPRPPTEPCHLIATCTPPLSAKPLNGPRITSKPAPTKNGGSICIDGLKTSATSKICRSHSKTQRKQRLLAAHLEKRRHRPSQVQRRKRR